jgi:UDP-N-acetylmuramoyl-L-alanyl-D-glutamate--2,6-diaminopimelate ligase
MTRRLKNLAHLLIACFANCYFGFPARSMTIIGVTGTDGKTTTASLIYDILQASGKKTALLTTVSATIDGKSYDTGFHVTTPNAWAIQKYLSLARKSGITHFVLETTSHALDQNRVFGITYSVSVVTNISQEHLDYHKTYENYVIAKAKLMTHSKVVILNKDDVSFPFLTQQISFHKINSKLVTYGLHEGSDITLEKYPLSPSMPGLFNTYNALAALAVCLQIGISYEQAKKVIDVYKTPVGRQDIVQKDPFTIMIDFAHTPNSFAALLASLKLSYSGRIIHVFGSAGSRDQQKRPEMGKISAEYSDIIVLTAEDPRKEDVLNIMEEISSEIPNSLFKFQEYNSKSILETDKAVYKISDRKEAIEFAISLARDGDIVIVTGKGHEKTMNMGEGEFEWSDHEAVKLAIKSLNDKK